ncbi:MAG: acetylxylan esterase [Anaerolineae bacterium]
MDEERRAELEKIKAGYPAGTILDEALVPEYTLPDPLVCGDGTPVTDAQTWFSRRRPEVYRLFEEQVFGRSPERPVAMRWEVTSAAADALDGRATRKEISLYPTGGAAPRIDVLLYVPNQRFGPAPAIVGLNYIGNQSVIADPGITLYEGWVPDVARLGVGGVVGNRATEATRGAMPNSMPVERMLERGYAVATLCCGDLAPDSEDVYSRALFPAYYPPGQTEPAADEWGVLAAWAWGMCRALDYLVTDPDVDATRIIAHGTSRLGKTALWAGALDERWAMILPNESGCGGAAISRRRFGETVARITTTFPRWFCANFARYGDNEDAMPFDQHMLIALSAPRSVYIASAEDDLWSDPRGEFLGALGAGPVYQLLGADGLGATEWPAVHAPVHSTLAYHLRAGGHGINAWDWEQFLDWADGRVV